MPKKIIKQKNLGIKDFSTHLFWDVNKTKLDLEKHEKYIINKVLQYGLINDWQFIYNYYGIQKIAKIAQKIRGLDKKTSSFIALLSDTPKENFLCYSTTQLKQEHWNF